MTEQKDKADGSSLWLGERLRIGRSLRSESQAETAVAIGCTQSQLSKLERGEREPSFKLIVNLARHFGLPLQWFLDGRLEPRGDRHALLHELAAYGIHDLQIATPLDPVGAFRSVEEVLCRSLAGRPEPRVLEALPVLVLKHAIARELLFAHARRLQVIRRTALICDIARHFYEAAPWARPAAAEFAETEVLAFLDEARGQLERASSEPEHQPRFSHPIWKRWKSDLETTLEEFDTRCADLLSRKSR